MIEFALPKSDKGVTINNEGRDSFGVQERSVHPLGLMALEIWPLEFAAALTPPVYLIPSCSSVI